MNLHLCIRQGLMAIMLVFTLVISTGCSDKVSRLFQAKLPVIGDAPTSSQVDPSDSVTTDDSARINSLGK
jgi:hypothetical protein